jgi:ribosome maturation factor RimP
VLTGVEGDNLQFEIRKQKITVPLSAVEKAKLVFEYKTNPKKK